MDRAVLRVLPERTGRSVAGHCYAEAVQGWGPRQNLGAVTFGSLSTTMINLGDIKVQKFASSSPSPPTPRRRF